MTDTVNVPLKCRQRLAAEGKAYPRSSCEVCGTFAPNWKSCDAALAAAPKAEPFEADDFGDALLAFLFRHGLKVALDVSEIEALRQSAIHIQPEAPKGETVDEEIGEEYDIAAHCVTLAECPAGLFFWNGSLGFKSEYGAMEPDETSNGKLWRVSNRPDAYCADSGEYFWGGASNHDDRAKLLVYPISAETVAMVASHGPAALFTHPGPASDELLEALERFVSSLTRDGKSRYGELSISHPDLTQLIERARATIAKYKGPQS